VVAAISKPAAAREQPKGETTAARTAAAATVPGSSSTQPTAEVSTPPARDVPPEEVVRPKLTPSEVAAVIRSHGRAFDACVAEWHVQEPQLDVSGVKVDIFITINPTGAVTWSILDNPEIDRSTLGVCLKTAGMMMVFPRFAGEAFDVRVPLTLGRMAH
jgi:hypothetical protein